MVGYYLQHQHEQHYQTIKSHLQQPKEKKIPSFKLKIQNVTINLSTKLSTNHQSTKQSINQPINHQSTKQSINQSINNNYIYLHHRVLFHLC